MHFEIRWHVRLYKVVELGQNVTMASADQLKALIKSHISRDDGRFFSVAMQVAAHEAKLGHGKFAEELRDLIDAAKARLSQDSSGKLVPIAGALNNAAKPRGELANLLSVTHPAGRMVDMVLKWTPKSRQESSLFKLGT